MTTIKDVAKKANVSISTVSHVINNTKHVKKSTKDRVNDAISELNYKTNIFAKNLKSQSTKHIGVILIDACGLFFPYVLKEIMNEAEKNGFSLTFFDTNCKISIEKNVIASLVDQCVDGIILSSAIAPSQKESYSHELRELLSASPKPIPLVMLERDFSDYGFDSVCTNTYIGGVMAVNHLIESGCKNIAHIAVPSGQGGRSLAYQHVLEINNLPFNPEYVEIGDYTHESGYRCMKKILEHNLPIDGVFSANDQMAVGVVRALKEANLDIPSDVKVIGFDNVFLCDSLAPPLSSIHVPKKELGKKSIDLLLERIKNGPAKIPYKETLKSFLIARESTGGGNPSFNQR